MTTKRTFTRLLAATVAGAWFAAGVSAPSLAADEVKIGAPLALTGGLADEGKKQAIAYDMWLKKVNDAGGITVGGKKMKVKIIRYDYQTDGKRAQQLAEKLITDDKVDVLMSPFGSGHTKIVAGVAERYGVPVVASVASSVSVYDQGYKYLFGTLAPNTGLTEAMLKTFTTQMKSVKKIAVLGRDDVFPKSMAQAMADTAKAGGLEVVYNQLYAVGTLDHAASLSKIKSLKPDWIYITGYTQDLILARKQMNDLKVTAPVVTMITGPAYAEFVEGLGPLAENISSTTWWHHSTTFKGNDPWGTTANFYNEFKAAQKADPDYVHASSAVALVVIQKAIEKAGSLDKKKVRDALASLDIQTFYGPIKFGPNGMLLVRSLPVIQVQKGKVAVLYPADIANAKLTPMK